MLIQTSKWILRSRQLTKQVSCDKQVMTIVEATDFKLGAASTVSVVGESGSGKSTLLNLWAGLDTPSQGEVELFGHRLDLLDEDGRAQVRLGQVGFVFQSFMLLPNLTAVENIMLAAELCGLADAKSRAMRWLSKVGLEHRATHRPAQLSGGEQQRVAIARAFVTSPAIVFADEPTGNLDSKTGALIADLLLQTQVEQPNSLVLITHDAGLAQTCEQQYRMSAGVLTQLEG